MTATPAHSKCNLEVIREGLTRQLLEQSGEHLKSLETIQIISRPYSVISFLSISTDRGTRRFVLKQIIQHPLNDFIVDEEPDQALVEYNLLTQLYSKFVEVERCSVPRPIVALPEIDAFIMEHVEGHELVDDLKYVHYLANRSRFRRLQDDFYDCGRWLRHFQQFVGLRRAGVSALDNVLVRANVRLRVIEESRDQRCPREFRKVAENYIEKQVDQLANTEILVTGRHGDLGPWNTLTGAGGITVLDFFGYREDPLPADIVGVLVYLKNISHNIANSTSRIQTLQDRFLAGLGPIPEVPPPLVLLCEAMQRIRSIAGSVIIRTGTASVESIGLPVRWERFRSLRANVNWFLTPPKESALWPR